MLDYKKYEEDCKRIRKTNEGLLEEFEAWLKASGLSAKTVNTHVANIDFYINEFLLYDSATEAQDGADEIGMFLGYWFIKKAMWASKSSIKGNATSLKKFYSLMHEKGLIDDQELTDLKRRMKEEMPDWLKTLERYDNPSIEEVW